MGDVYGPRRRRDGTGWCARYLTCGGIDVPTWVGGGEVELCEGCERARVADVPDPDPLVELGGES